MLRIIERVTKQPIELMKLPTVEDVNQQRVQKFKERIADAVQSGEGKLFQPLLEQMEREQNVPAIEIAAALASLLQGSHRSCSRQNRVRRPPPHPRLAVPDARLITAKEESACK